MDAMTETFEQYKADEAICDGTCGCALCRDEATHTTVLYETAVPGPVKVFAESHVQLQGATITDMLARVLRWQHQNSTAQPVSVHYAQVGNWHTASIAYIEPYEES